MKNPIKFLFTVILLVLVVSCGNDDKKEEKLELTVDNHLYEGDLYAYYLRGRINEINDSIAYYEHLGQHENYIGLLKAERTKKGQELTNQEKITSTALRDIPKIDLNSFGVEPPPPPPSPCDRTSYSNKNVIGVINLNAVNFTKSKDVERLTFELSSTVDAPIEFVINNSSLDVANDLKYISTSSLVIMDPPCFYNLKVNRLKNNVETSYVIKSFVFIKED